MKNELQELIELYIKNRKMFVGLISFEEFKNDYVKRCEDCGDFFIAEYGDETKCEECLEEEPEREIDPDWEDFDRNKDYYYYGLEY